MSNTVQKGGTILKSARSHTFTHQGRPPAGVSTNWLTTALRAWWPSAATARSPGP
ncbi:MAG: hypothetical protein WKG07_25005 [Hymenobacter sp.]